jgi:hypothetical protein
MGKKAQAFSGSIFCSHNHMRAEGRGAKCHCRQEPWIH